MLPRTRRLGPIVALAFGATLLAPGTVGALPPGAPRIGLVCTTGSLAGTTRTFSLVANTGYIQTPDGNAVFMWSYSVDGDPNYPTFQSPGPFLCANQGETVVVNLRNTLPEATSIVFPGQDARITATGGAAGLLTTEAPASGGTASYSFPVASPGTYLYESGSDISKQIEMGLYGGLIVRPSAGANFAYDGTTQFDPSREFVMLLAEVDPDLHHAVETGAAYDFSTLVSRYFTINGRSFPDTVQDNGTALLPTQPYGALVRIQPNTATSTLPALVRILNAGALNHPFHPHGNHTTEIAKDGRLLLSPGGSSASTQHFDETVGSGETQDFLLRWDDQDNFSPSNPLPVAPPNYQNVTFKDGTTWYSGSPYLGYKGTLPNGTNSLNVCGEWYFPLHSHALNEFTNFDVGFGGMGTLLRVDPAGGCFAFSTSTSIIGGVLKSGSVTALGSADSTWYQVNPKTTTRPTATAAGQTSITVQSASGFPTTGTFYVRIDNEVMQVTGGQGTTTWTVARGQLGTTAATHATGATVTALATDWYAAFTGFPVGASNLKVTYQGEDCGSTTGSTCASLTTNLPQQTVKICNWTIAPVGCPTATAAGWVTLPAPPSQPISVGSSDVSSTWTLPGSAASFVGTGPYKGQVRILVHTQRWTPSNPTPFSTWANFMKITYDAP